MALIEPKILLVDTPHGEPNLFMYQNQIGQTIPFKHSPIPIPEWFTDDDPKYRNLFQEVWLQIPEWAKMAINEYPIAYVGDRVIKSDTYGLSEGDSNGQAESAAFMMGRYDENGFCIEFGLNKKFIETLKYYEAAKFLIAHELAHVAAGHLAADLALSSVTMEPHQHFFFHQQREIQADFFAVLWGFDPAFTEEHWRGGLIAHFKRVAPIMRGNNA